MTTTTRRQVRTRACSPRVFRPGAPRGKLPLGWPASIKDVPIVNGYSWEMANGRNRGAGLTCRQGLETVQHVVSSGTRCAVVATLRRHGC